MEPLIKLVTEKTGISETQAKQAIETVLSFVKDKLPAGLGNPLDSITNSSDKPTENGVIDKLKGHLGIIN